VEKLFVPYITLTGGGKGVGTGAVGAFPVTVRVVGAGAATQMTGAKTEVSVAGGGGVGGDVASERDEVGADLGGAGADEGLQPNDVVRGEGEGRGHAARCRRDAFVGR
jgi:hypothetical protein